MQLSIKRIAYRSQIFKTSKLVKIINKDKQHTALLVVKTTVLITALVLQGKDVIFEGQMVIISHHTTCGVAATRVIEISRNTHTQEEAAARMVGRCCCRCYRKWLVSHAVQAAILDFEF